MDTVGTWLSGLPANPIADFLSGGLWLVRRTLFPVGADVGLWGSAACVNTGDCSDRDLTGANLVGKDLSAVYFVDATLVRSNLAGANLVGADLTGANLTGANLIGALGLFPETGVGTPAWNNGYDLWYRTKLEIPGAGVTIWPALRGTPGAPLIGSYMPPVNWGYPHDGVQGIVYNQSSQTIAVRTVGIFENRITNWDEDVTLWQTAILQPGDAVSYQLFTTFWANTLSHSVSYLSFYRVIDDAPVGDPVRLGLLDPFVGRPSTYFEPPGVSQNPSPRTGWREGEEHHDIWGSIDIATKREGDGWQINASPEYLARYPNPSNKSTSDWAVFTVNVYNL